VDRAVCRPQGANFGWITGMFFGRKPLPGVVDRSIKQVSGAMLPERLSLSRCNSVSGANGTTIIILALNRSGQPRNVTFG
jgi:hypothetical protein